MDEIKERRESTTAKKGKKMGDWSVLIESRLHFRSHHRNRKNRFVRQKKRSGVEGLRRHGKGGKPEESGEREE